jgi:hypothetical protein
MKKILCVLVLALALGGIFALPFSWLTRRSMESSEASAQTLALEGTPEPVAMKIKAPEIVEIEEWINSKPLKLKDLRGKVVALHFWTFG